MTGAAAGISALVSIRMAAGHLWLERMRMIDRSTSLSEAATAVDVGKYQSATNSKPSSTPPTHAKYRTRSIDLTATDGPHIGTGQQATGKSGNCSSPERLGRNRLRKKCEAARGRPHSNRKSKATVTS